MLLRRDPVGDRGEVLKVAVKFLLRDVGVLDPVHQFLRLNLLLNLFALLLRQPPGELGLHLEGVYPHLGFVALRRFVRLQLLVLASHDHVHRVNSGLLSEVTLVLLEVIVDLFHLLLGLLRVELPLPRRLRLLLSNHRGHHFRDVARQLPAQFAADFRIRGAELTASDAPDAGCLHVFLASDAGRGLQSLRKVAVVALERHLAKDIISLQH